MSGSPEVTGEFPHTWQARTLPRQPVILPARHFVLPRAVPGEEDALARGALWMEVKPEHGGTFAVQCALGFAGRDVATGIWSTPHPDVLLAIAGGYAYLIETLAPENSILLPMRPVVQVHVAVEARALILTGFHTLYVVAQDGAWETPRLSWEGVSVERIEKDEAHGTGWHMRTDRELPFTLNLRTRAVSGGAFLP